MIKIGGIYRHFKGKMVRVLMIARDSENLTDVVVYIELDDGSIWTRPAAQWFDRIVRDGVDAQRFTEV